MKLQLNQTLNIDNPIVLQEDVLFDANGANGISVYEFGSTQTWPSQTDPTALEQNAFAIEGTNTSLIMGDSDAETSNDPLWVPASKGFQLSSNGFMSATSGQHEFTGDYLISTWIKAGAAIGGTSKTILGIATNWTSDAQYWMSFSASNQIRFYSYYSGGNFTSAQGSALVEGQIYQVAASFQQISNDGVVRLYVDGEEVATGTNAGDDTLSSTTGRLGIGRLMGGSSFVANDEIIYRCAFEDLVISGNDPAAQVAAEYEEYKNVFY